MSLIIVTEQKNSKGNYEITEEKLRNLIEDAYNKGYMDGKKDATPCLNYPQGWKDLPTDKINKIDPYWGVNPAQDYPGWWKDGPTCTKVTGIDCAHSSTDSPKTKSIEVETTLLNNNDKA